MDEAMMADHFKGAELLALDEALSAFSDLYPRHIQVVELRFFAGLSVEETATALGVSIPTIVRDWKFARSWLMSRMRAVE